MKSQFNARRLSNIGVLTAFGISMTAGVSGDMMTALIDVPRYSVVDYESMMAMNTIPLSSLEFKKQAIGDIVVQNDEMDCLLQHKKIPVKLKIESIIKHVSSFEFDEEFEEI